MLVGVSVVGSFVELAVVLITGVLVNNVEEVVVIGSLEIRMVDVVVEVLVAGSLLDTIVLVIVVGTLLVRSVVVDSLVDEDRPTKVPVVGSLEDTLAVLPVISSLPVEDMEILDVGSCDDDLVEVSAVDSVVEPALELDAGSLLELAVVVSSLEVTLVDVVVEVPVVNVGTPDEVVSDVGS